MTDLNQMFKDVDVSLSFLDCAVKPSVRSKHEFIGREDRPDVCEECGRHELDNHIRIES